MAFASNACASLPSSCSPKRTCAHTADTAAAAAAAKSLQSCPTLCDPIDGSPPGSASLGFSRQEHWGGLPFPSPHCWHYPNHNLSFHLSQTVRSAVTQGIHPPVETDRSQVEGSLDVTTPSLRGSLCPYSDHILANMPTFELNSIKGIKMLVLSSCRPSTFGRDYSPPTLSLSIRSEDRENHTFLPLSPLSCQGRGLWGGEQRWEVHQICVGSNFATWSSGRMWSTPGSILILKHGHTHWIWTFG